MNTQKLKAKLTELAEAYNVSFNEIWHRLVMERFLARLSSSRYVDFFIFKGGFLLTKYTGRHRETRDLDFLLDRYGGDRASVTKALEDIGSITLEDGFRFTLESLSDLPHEHMKYPGFRGRYKVHLEGMREILEIDIGLGDDVEPLEDSFVLLSPKGGSLFEDEITLSMYPAESIFAEKLETAVSRGEFNSRMNVTMI